MMLALCLILMTVAFGWGLPRPAARVTISFVAFATSSARSSARFASFFWLTRSASMFFARAVSSIWSKGLLRKSLMPSVSARWRSSRSSAAVTMSSAAVQLGIVGLGRWAKVLTRAARKSSKCGSFAG